MPSRSSWPEPSRRGARLSSARETIRACAGGGVRLILEDDAAIVSGGRRSGARRTATMRLRAVARSAPCTPACEPSRRTRLDALLGAAIAVELAVEIFLLSEIHGGGRLLALLFAIPDRGRRRAAPARAAARGRAHRERLPAGRADRPGLDGQHGQPVLLRAARDLHGGHAARGRCGWPLAFVLGATLLCLGVASDSVPDDAANFIFSVILAVAAPMLFGQIMRTRTRLNRALREKAARAEAERARRAEAAALEERTRIAGELHDVVAHALSAMTVQAAGARRLAVKDPARAEAAFAAVEATGREALTELRRLLGVLRKEDEELALAPQPSLAHVAALARRMRAAGPARRAHGHRATRGRCRRASTSPPTASCRRRSAARATPATPAAPRCAWPTARDDVRVEVVDDGVPGGRAAPRACASAWRSTAASSARAVADGGGWSVSARLPVGAARMMRLRRAPAWLWDALLSAALAALVVVDLIGARRSATCHGPPPWPRSPRCRWCAGAGPLGTVVAWAAARRCSSSSSLDAPDTLAVPFVGLLIFPYTAARGRRPARARRAARRVGGHERERARRERLGLGRHLLSRHVRHAVLARRQGGAQPLPPHRRAARGGGAGRRGARGRAPRRPSPTSAAGSRARCTTWSRTPSPMMVVQAGGARRILARDPERAVEAAALIERTGREALAEMRHLLGVLHAEDGHAPEFAPQPTLGAARRAGGAARARPACPSSVRVEGEQRELPAGLDLAAYRVVQEALTNVIKHGGGAATEVLRALRGDAVELSVADRGDGALRAGLDEQRRRAGRDARARPRVRRRAATPAAGAAAASRSAPGCRCRTRTRRRWPRGCGHERPARPHRRRPGARAGRLQDDPRRRGRPRRGRRGGRRARGGGARPPAASPTSC